MLNRNSKRRANRNRAGRRTRNIGLESLELRRVLANCTGLDDVATHFQAEFADVATLVNTNWKATELPLIGDHLANVPSPVDSVATAIGNAFDELGANAADSEVQDAIADELEAVGIEPTVLEVSCGGGNIEVQLDLSRELSLTGESASFDIGIAPLPIFSINGEQNLDLGVGLSGLDFSFGIDGGVPTFDMGDGQFDLSLYADFSGTGFDAVVGLLAGEVSVESREPTEQQEGLPGFDHPLEVTLTVDLNGGEPVSLDAGAHFDLVFAAGANEALVAGLPAVEATVAVDWYGADPDQPEPSVEFQGVSIKFGELISKIFEPIIEHVGPIVDKIAAVYDLLEAPIPVLKELVDPDPTVLSILSLTGNLGTPEYQAVVKFLEASSLIVGIADSLESDDGELVMELGNFDLSANGDLRTLGTSTLPGLANLSIPDLSFSPLGSTMDLDALVDWANDNLPPVMADSIGSLVDHFDDPVQVSLPMLTDPAGSVFNLLLGQDVDFFRVDVDFHGSGGFDPEVSVPGFSFTFGNEINWDVTVGLGLDTRGIRNFIGSVADGAPTAGFFGEGFYVTEDTEVRLSAGLVAEFGVNLVFVHGAISGGVEGFLEVAPTPSDDWVGTDAPDDKLYIRSDLGECLGHATGGISAFLDAWVGVGAKIPFTDIFVGGKKEFNIAHKNLFSFGDICIPNPFTPFDEETFEPATKYEDQTEADLDNLQPGELWLNIGNRAHLRNFLPDHEHEFITVEHIGVDEDGDEIVNVSFAGHSREYSGVERIVAHGHDGADRIEILEGVTSDVLISGGNGPDTIISRTTGSSTLYGDDLNFPISLEDGDSDDVLEGGLGPNTLEGGIGNDQLVGGPQINILIGGADDDILIGGPEHDQLHGDYVGAVATGGDDAIYGGGGADLIFGGGGNDMLFGCGDSATDEEDCDGQNTIHGYDGNDTIFAGPSGDIIFAGNGSDDVHAGSGDDEIATYEEFNAVDADAYNNVYWEEGDGSTLVLNSPYSIDTVSLFGSAAADSFVVEDGNTLPLPGNEFEIAVQAPGGETVTSTNISQLNIDGQDESDTILLHPLTHHPAAVHPLEYISVNMAEEFRDDGEEDHVYVHGTSDADTLTVDSQQVLLQENGCNGPNQPGNLGENEKSGSSQQPGQSKKSEGSGKSGTPKETEDSGGCQWGGVMTINGFPEYEIIVTNLMDDLQILTFDGQDEVTVLGNTGPTLVDTGADDDEVLVTARTPGQPTLPWQVPIEADYLDTLTVEAGSGKNMLRVYESQSEISDTIHLDADRISSQLLPRVNYRATGGKFDKVELAGGPHYDGIHVHATHEDVEQTVVAGFFDPMYAGLAAGDQIYVSSTGGLDGDLRGIHNRLLVVGHNDNQTLVHIGDRSATSGNATVSVVGDEIKGLAGEADEATIEIVSGLLEFHLYGSDDPKLDEVFELDAPDAPIVIHGGQGNERVVVTELLMPAIVIGEAGDDTTTVPDLGAIHALLDVRGQGGVDQVAVADEAAPAGSNYVLTGMHLQRGGSLVLYDDSLEHMRVATSTLTDQVFVTQTPAATNVQFNQGGGDNSLYGPHSASNWQITGIGRGTLNDRVAFRGTRNLFGGVDDDRFQLDGGGIPAVIHGGAGGGRDVLDYSSHVTPVKFVIDNAVGDGAAPAIGSFSDIESLVGGSDPRDSLRGFDADLTWEVTDADAGVFDSAGLAIEFGSVEFLIGGAGSDLFTIHENGAISGQIHGGPGADTLDYSPSTTAVSVDLALRDATRIGKIRSIVNVVGGSGDDILLGNDQANDLSGGPGHDILVGKAGNDRLAGGTGRDLLIGGKGQDLLHGRQGDDILVGGSTVHDDDPFALDLIRQEWTRLDLSYQDRIGNLMKGGGLNGKAVLDSDTVLPDDEVDQLFGDSDQDWFWSDPADLLDAAADEKVAS